MKPYIEAYERISEKFDLYHDLGIKPIRIPKNGKLVEVRTDKKIKRNEICPLCDSGKKYKKCCGNIKSS